MNQKDIFLWLVLIALTLIGFFLSESTMSKSVLVVFLAATTIIKFLGVGFQFMELKKAHLFWKLSFVSILALFVILMVAFSL